MANNKFNARHGLSVGQSPVVDVVDNAGEVLTNSASATKLKTARTIGLLGNITGSVSFDGTSDVNITTTLAPDANKTFTDNATFFQDNGDNSKKMLFDLASISANTTRTITVPDASLTLVGVDTTQTLTNKTLTSPAISGGTINNTPIGGTTANTGAFTTLTANGATTLTANTASTNSTTGTLVVTGGVGISGTLHVGTNIGIGGNIDSGTWQGNVISSTYGGTGINNAGRTLTISTGNLAFTAHANGSSVTVPETGTLATLAGTETLTNKTLGATTISGNLVPDTDVTYNLGSATKRFKDLFLSGSTINLGAATISSTAASVSISAIDSTPIGGTTPSTAAFTTLTANGATTLTANTASTSTSTGTLVVTGGVGISQNLYVGGNLVINGITTTVNSTTVTVDDPIFTLGGDVAPTADDTKDRGIEFRWYDSQARAGFFGFDASSGKFTFIPNATNTAEVFSGTKGTIDAYIEWADVLSKPDPVVTVTLTGDVTGTANTTLTDLASGTITIETTVAANSVALGDDTTGNYMVNVTAGTGIAVTHTQSEGSTATVAHGNTSDVASLTASGRTYVTGLTFDDFGHVTALTTGTETVVDTNTTYSLDGSSPSANNVNIDLVAGGSGSGTDSINVVGSGATSVSWDETNQRITISSTDNNTTYTAGTGLTLTGTEFTVNSTSKSNWDTAYTDRLKWDGGSTGLTASTGRTSLGATTVGSNFFTLTNPGAVSFVRINADNTVSTLNASDFLTAIGTGSGTVSSISAGNGITTLVGGSTLSNVAITQATPGGQFTCNAATLTVGDLITISGTEGAGYISGFVSPTTYKVSAVVGTSPNVTGFTLTTIGGASLTTAYGYTPNLIYTVYSSGAITNSGIVAVDTSVVATLAGSQTLTNKTFTDSSTVFQDETDNTKKMAFQLSGISANNTRVLTIPNASGTIALTTDIPTVNNGTLSTTAGTAGSTNTTVALELSAAYSANTASNVTIKPVVGPALTNLATLMTTAGAGFIKRGATADTYTIDTNTYLTSYTETDNLASVTARGASTTFGMTVNSADQSIVAQSDGNSAGWRGRILSKNSTIDKAVFLGTYASTTAGVFAHNNALNGWATLHINTTTGTGDGADVILAGTGKVALGLASPVAKLDIAANTPASDIGLRVKSNTAFLSPDGNNTITLRMLDTDTLSFSGNTGQLFSISDSMTGTIFSVNDISGMPSIEVFDTGKVQIAELTGNVLLGSSTDNGVDKLQVTGSARVTTALGIGGSVGTAYPLYVQNAQRYQIGLKNTGGTNYWWLAHDTNDNFVLHANALGDRWTISSSGNITPVGWQRMGTFAQSQNNTGEAWIGRATDRSTGTMTVQLGNDASRTFEVVDNVWSTVIFNAGMNSFAYKGNAIWHAGNDGASSGLDADLLDGNHASAFALAGHTHDDRYYTETESDDRFLRLDFPTTTAAAGWTTNNGAWTTSASTTEWGSYKPGDDSAGGYAYNDAPGWAQYNIPSGYSTVYIGQLRWDTGGYFDVHAVRSDGTLVFRGRYLSRNTIENANHGGDHDGQQVIKVSGLDGMTAVRITNVVGRLHLQGLGWTKEQDTAGTQVSETHWDLIYQKPSTFTPSTHSHAILTFNSSGGAAAGTTYDASTARTIDYSTVGAAAASHTHSYLPLGGGTMTGDITYGTTGLGLQWTMNTDAAYIKFYNTGNGDTDSRLEYGTADDGNEYHRWMVSSAEKMNLKSDALNVTVGKISVGSTATYMTRNSTTGCLEFYV